MAQNISCVIDKDTSSYYRGRRFCAVLFKLYTISKQIQYGTLGVSSHSTL